MKIKKISLLSIIKKTQSISETLHKNAIIGIRLREVFEKVFKILELTKHNLTDVTASNHPERAYPLTVYYIYDGETSNVYLSYLTKSHGSVLTASIVNFSALVAEREVHEMFGVIFLNHRDLRKLLLDYGASGNPLLKSYPLPGYTQIAYTVRKGLVFREIALNQTLRILEYKNPWVIFMILLCILIFWSFEKRTQLPLLLIQKRYMNILNRTEKTVTKVTPTTLFRPVLRQGPVYATQNLRNLSLRMRGKYLLNQDFLIQYDYKEQPQPEIDLIIQDAYKKGQINFVNSYKSQGGTHPLVTQRIFLGGNFYLIILGHLSTELPSMSPDSNRIFYDYFDILLKTWKVFRLYDNLLMIPMSDEHEFIRLNEVPAPIVEIILQELPIVLQEKYDKDQLNLNERRERYTNTQPKKNKIIKSAQQQQEKNKIEKKVLLKRLPELHAEEQKERERLENIENKDLLTQVSKIDTQNIENKGLLTIAEDAKKRNIFKSDPLKLWQKIEKEHYTVKPKSTRPSKTTDSETTESKPQSSNHEENIPNI